MHLPKRVNWGPRPSRRHLRRAAFETSNISAACFSLSIRGSIKLFCSISATSIRFGVTRERKVYGDLLLVQTQAPKFPGSFLLDCAWMKAHYSLSDSR